MLQPLWLADRSFYPVPPGSRAVLYCGVLCREYVFNTFAFGYALGYHFVASPQGICFGCPEPSSVTRCLKRCHGLFAGSCNGNFVGIGADSTLHCHCLSSSPHSQCVLVCDSVACNASVLVEAADRYGILITNGEFTSFVDPNFGTEVARSTQVRVWSLQPLPSCLPQWRLLRCA